MTGLVLALLLAQAPVTTIVPEDGTNKAVQVGDFTNKAIRVNCVTGCSGGEGGGLTDAQLRASPVPVSGTVAVTDNNGSLTVDGTVSVSGTIPVSGTFWQATQPVSGTFWQATQPVSGPLTDAQLRATAVPVSGTFWQATQPVSGTVAATQSGTWTVQPGNTANTTPWLTDDVASSGVGATSPTSAQLVGGRATADAAAPTARAAGQLADLVTTLDGRLLVETSHPRRFHCAMTSTATAATAITGCAAVASNSYYITDITFYSGVATGATAPEEIRYGTGAACATGTVTVFRCMHPATNGCVVNFNTPIKTTAGVDLCFIAPAAGTKGLTVSGYIAP